MYEVSRKQFVFFFVFSVYLNPIGFAPINGLWRKVFVKALPNSKLLMAPRHLPASFRP